MHGCKEQALNPGRCFLRPHLLEFDGISFENEQKRIVPVLEKEKRR